MTDDNDTKKQAIAPPKPDQNPAWRRMDRLIGSWEMNGGPAGGDQSAMTGKFTFQWILGDKDTALFLQQDMEMDFAGTKVVSREIIGYDPKTDTFPSHVYSNMSPEALPYRWNIQDDGSITIIVDHGEISSTYHGKFAPDGNSFSGGWRPNPGADENINPAYDDIATRIV